MTSIATGQGAVRRMHFAPPTCSQLDHVAGSLTGPSLSARVCCLFVNGAFGVWELDSRNELRAVCSSVTKDYIHGQNTAVMPLCAQKRVVHQQSAAYAWPELVVLKTFLNDDKLGYGTPCHAVGHAVHAGRMYEL